ncbi:C-C chemokine receptor type 1-like [Gigantopelta aegis]|uniref:C-C chemokine receptor type 1-like n=1 Tax=Gigantopelta aegis TaxID=1735272 RepID=UPI001B88D469|nr:C-C chemokine receptor type 1-like [Gigantopelta aegis]
MTTQNVRELAEYKVAVALMNYMSPCLMLLGLVGNTIVFVVLAKSSMRETTTSLYLRFLAVFDSLVLYVGLMRHWIIYLVEYDIRDYSPVVCKIHTWGNYWAIHTSAWLLVSVTLERCFSVWFPHKVKMICTRRKTYTIIITIMLVLATLNAHYLYGLGEYIETIENETFADTCDSMYSDYYDFELLIWPWVDICIYSVFPSSILIMCNISIIYKVVTSSRQVLHHDFSNGNSIQNRSVASRQSQSSSLTVMLLSVSFTYVVCTTPFSIFVIYSNVFAPGEYESAHDQAVDKLVWSVVNMLQYTNNCINFILYCVSGKRFRNELSGLCSRQDRSNPEIYSVPLSNSGTNTTSTAGPSFGSTSIFSAN